MKERTEMEETGPQALARIASLEKALEEARASSVAKTHFLANMSHEIRTPMNAILGMTELLLHAGLQSEYAGYLRNIHHASESLLKIIDDILDFSKISAGKLEILNNPYEFGALLNDVCGIIGMRAAEKGVEFIVEIDPSIPAMLIGDEGRIKQILINLLGNAVKYTRRGHVALKIVAHSSEGDVRLQCSVSDTGIGIKEKDISRVFGLFEQLDTRANREITGTGLGLAIARQLIEMMDGAIQVHSEYGQGTEFTFHIIQQPSESAALASVERPSSIHALFVSPSHHWASVYMTMAERLGIQAQCIVSTSQLESILSTGRFSDLFYDYAFAHETLETQMPLPTGLRVTAMYHMGSVASRAALPGQGIVIGPLLPHALAQILNGCPDRFLAHGPETTGGLGSFKAPGVRVLVVDDNSVNLTVAGQLLANYGLVVDTAENGLEALTKVRTNPYDLVFMDHMMPILDGVDTAKAIRGFGERYRRLPIVALTANAIAGVQDEFFAAGMNDFLAKPIEIRKLNVILRKWIPAWKIEEKSLAGSASQLGDWTKCAVAKRLRGIEGLELDDGVSRVGNSFDAFQRVLRAFVSSMATVPGRIESLCSDGALEALRMEFHSMKSGLASAGCYDLSVEARKLEIAAHEKRLDAVGQGTPRFLQKVRLLVDEISCALDLSSPLAAPSQPGEPAELRKRIVQALAAIESLEHGQALDSMKIACSRSYGKKHDELLQTVFRAVESFDYDQATLLLKKIQ
jgi:CheY-like chemotaxis protein